MHIHIYIYIYTHRLPAQVHRGVRGPRGREPTFEWASCEGLSGTCSSVGRMLALFIPTLKYKHRELAKYCVCLCLRSRIDLTDAVGLAGPRWDAVICERQEGLQTAYLYIYIYICMCVYVCIYTDYVLCMYVCICIYIYIYIYVSLSLYIIYIYIYICIGDVHFNVKLSNDTMLTQHNLANYYGCSFQRWNKQNERACKL